MSPRRGHDRHADRRRGDHVDVHVLVGEDTEHLGGDARRRLHARTDDRHLGDVVVVRHAGRTDLGGDPRHDRLGLVHVGHRHREADVGGAGDRRVLHDHVDVHVGRRERLEQGRRDARAVGHAEHGDLRFGHVGDDTGDDRIFHRGLLIGDPRARFPSERGADVERNVMGAGELDRAEGEHLGAGAGHLEHLVEVHPGQLARLGHDAWISGEHTGDIGVDLAGVGLQGLGERGRGEIGGTAAHRGDLLVGAHPLESRDHGDLARGERLADPVALHLEDLRLAVRGVGDDADLAAGEADGVDAAIGERHASSAPRSGAHRS